MVRTFAALQPSPCLAIRALPVALALLAPFGVGAAGLTIEDAIRAAWQDNPGLAASAAGVEAARSEATAAREAWLPTLALTARGIGTDEPMTAFGLRLDQQRITQADFAPARLNAPAFIGGIGVGAGLSMPLYVGGRISAGRRASSAQAEAEADAHDHRRQEMARSVVEAYFATEAASQGVQYAEDQLQSARETERFVRERNRQGLVLDADLARATAFRAQAEAERAAALQGLASARSALALLAGEEAGQAELTTPFDVRGSFPAAEGTRAAERSDLQAARSRVDAAQNGVVAARAGLLPQVLAQGSVETMRSDFDQGATWGTVALVARWQFGLPDLRATQAARARARAAEESLHWQELQARREVDEARRAVETAGLRVASAREAVWASESARSLRQARHRQGLLPLTDVLDAEAGLALARSLWLHSRLEARVARAQLDLALGQPVEGVKP